MWPRRPRTNKFGGPWLPTLTMPESLSSCLEAMLAVQAGLWLLFLTCISYIIVIDSYS